MVWDKNWTCTIVPSFRNFFCTLRVFAVAFIVLRRSIFYLCSVLLSRESWAEKVFVFAIISFFLCFLFFFFFVLGKVVRYHIFAGNVLVASTLPGMSRTMFVSYRVYYRPTLFLLNAIAHWNVLLLRITFYLPFFHFFFVLLLFVVAWKWIGVKVEAQTY